MGKRRDRVCLEDGRKLDLNSMARKGIVCPGAIGSRGMQWSREDEVVGHALISYDMSGERQGWLSGSLLRLRAGCRRAVLDVAIAQIRCVS